MIFLIFFKMKSLQCFLSVCVLFLVFIPFLVHGVCTCQHEEEQGPDKTQALTYKLVAFGAILVAGGIGIWIPMLGKAIPAISSDKNAFFLIKAFAAGVILATGFIHILPDAFQNLTSPCLSQPWQNFPFSGLIAMMSAVVTLMIESYATLFSNKRHSHKSDLNPEKPHLPEHEGDVQKDEFKDPEKLHQKHEEHVHAHIHGDSYGSESSKINKIRSRVVSQVLELGILVHSVIIGITLGVSHNPRAIRPLIAALSFHQFFEGMGLGSCISQANLKRRSIIVMTIFFSLTTPVGIVLGISISNVYIQNSPTALTVEGILNAVAAGILIYMALVDLLATDFMGPRLQNNAGLHIGANLTLVLGASCMAYLAAWA